jgi:3-dehydroquinate dehydratase/shikimate dehydrogenase
VTVTADTTAELRAARDRVVGADLVELRLDTVRDPDVAGAIADRRGPVIVTCRARWEGGAFAGSEDERKAILREALDQDAEYVDIEWRAGFEDVIAMTGGRRVVLSSHDFEGMPDDLVDRAQAMRGTGAEVVKIAAKTTALSDCLKFLDPEVAGGRHGKSVLIGMGESGLATRVLAARFGSAWTYAGALGQVGQIDAATLLGRYRFNSITPATAIYGVVGSPVGHSVSPAMHNAALAAAGIDAVYLPLLARDANDFLDFADGLGLAGASITIPFKVALAERATGIDEMARQIGAINTVKRRPHGWDGRNTDADGFLQPLRDREVALSGSRAAILGAGGSARAVAVALASAGAQVTVYARDAARADALAASVTAAAEGTLAGSVGAAAWPPARGAWDLLVNCTPVGMHPKSADTPLEASQLTPGAIVYDLVYNPGTTRLLREAHTAGCRVIGGLDMLVAQAVAQFTWWTGVPPSAEVMRAAALERLSEFQHP